MFRLVILSCLLVGAALGKPRAPRDALQPVPAAADGPLPYAEPIPFAVTALPQVPVNKLAAGTYQYNSPNYGSGDYANDYDFATTVTGKDGQAVSISCGTFNVEDAEGCEYDFLSINGVKSCGSSPVAAVSSATLVIKFHTDTDVTASGFSCTIVVPTAGSGGSGGSGGSTSCTCGKRQTGRVVGGTAASAGLFPWQAGLVQTGGTRTFCGGSVINNRYVLTAAHCIADTTAIDVEILLGDLKIGAADAGEKRFKVTQIIKHSQYTDPSSTGFDFALLKLDGVIIFSNTIQPVCLGESGQSYAGATGLASGFGKLGADAAQATVLQHVQLPVWSHATCKTQWENIKENMICAGGRNAGGQGVCMGDSGGPLVTEVSSRFRLIGVVSYGMPCAVAGMPDVFARVTAVLPWIADNTKDAQYCSA